MEVSGVPLTSRCPISVGVLVGALSLALVSLAERVVENLSRDQLVCFDAPLVVVLKCFLVDFECWLLDATASSFVLAERLVVDEGSLLIDLRVFDGPGVRHVDRLVDGLVVLQELPDHRLLDHRLVR